MDENRIRSELGDDPAEWRMIAAAARRRAEQEAVTLPPLPDLNDKETQSMNTLVYHRPRTQSATWGILAASIITLLGAFLMLSLMPRSNSPLPAATIPLIQQQTEEEPLTAYDIISRDDDLREFTALVDASPEHKTYLQSGEPVVVFAPFNRHLAAGVDSSILEDLIIIPNNEWIETPNYFRVERSYVLAGSGMVNAVRFSAADAWNDPDSRPVPYSDGAVVLPSGYSAISVPLEDFSIDINVDETIYIDAIDAEALVMLIGTEWDNNLVILAMLPEDIVRLDEVINDGESPQFSRTITFMESEPGSCGSQPITEDTSWGNPMTPGSYTMIREFSSYHSGIDLAAPVGTPVYATNEGRVIFAGWNSYGYGNMIALLHGGHISVYAHLSDVNVACGETVTGEQIIGAVGMTGNASAPHLHFEIRRVQVDGYTEPVDPALFFDFGN